jgi:hypothetical protein
MFKLNSIIIIFLLSFSISSKSLCQSTEGLKQVVSSQQEKIITMEDTLKELRGMIEEQSLRGLNNNKNNVNSSELDDINNNIKIMQNKINNITELSFNLEFALKRIERHLELSSINSKAKFNKQNPNKKK